MHFPVLVHVAGLYKPACCFKTCMAAPEAICCLQVSRGGPKQEQSCAKEGKSNSLNSKASASQQSKMSDQLRASSSSDAASSAPQQVCHGITGGLNDHIVFALSKINHCCSSCMHYSLLWLQKP